VAGVAPKVFPTVEQVMDCIGYSRKGIGSDEDDSRVDSSTSRRNKTKRRRKRKRAKRRKSREESVNFVIGSSPPPAY